MSAIERGLIALSNAYELDGRVSTHPADVRGWAPMNVYVLREGDHALVIDSGLTVHRAALLERLATVVDERTELTFLPFRYGELNSLTNFGAFAERFGVRRVIGDFFGPPYEWLDFLPGSPGIEVLAKAEVEPFPTTGSIAIDPSAERRLRTFVPPIWLLPNAWAYDAETRTLFTSDMFAWAARDAPDARWVVEAGDDSTTEDDVWRALCRNMYWWLPGARTDGMRRELAATFDRHDVETIAPGYGCVLSGTRVVERHVALLDAVLARAADAESYGLDVGNWKHDGGRVA